MPAHPHTAIPPAHRKPLGADSPLYHWWITAALMLGFMTAGLSVTVVQLAFPHIMTSLRASYQVLVCILDGEIPACREQSLAFTALEESAMWAMKALALTDPGGVQVDPPREDGA